MTRSGPGASHSSRRTCSSRVASHQHSSVHAGRSSRHQERRSASRRASRRSPDMGTGHRPRGVAGGLDGQLRPPSITPVSRPVGAGPRARFEHLFESYHIRLDLGNCTARGCGRQAAPCQGARDGVDSADSCSPSAAGRRMSASIGDWFVRGPLTRVPSSRYGGLPEWPKGADCKSAGSAYVGSNPTPATRDRGAPAPRRGASAFPGRVGWDRSGGPRLRQRGGQARAPARSAIRCDDQRS